MSRKMLVVSVCILSLAAIAFMLVLQAGTAHAQCEGPDASSCSNCHAQEDPVNENGEWHIIHANKDICLNCHGGNGTTMDKELAHEGITAHPLEDIYTDCHSCHPDYDERAAQFAPILGVTPSSCSTPTPIPISNNTNQGLPVSNTSPVTSTASPQQTFMAISIILAALALFLLGLGWLQMYQTKNK